MTATTVPSSSFMPGELRVEPGNRCDYAALTRHHYRAKRPATFCEIRVARYIEPGAPDRLVGVAVLSWPVPMLTARCRHLGLPAGYGDRLRFANANVRTVSRVIVHPQFRALGVATRLVRELIDVCPTRYVESSAAMGAYATFLLAAGMGRVPTLPSEPAYFLVDRAESRTKHQ